MATITDITAIEDSKEYTDWKIESEKLKKVMEGIFKQVKGDLLLEKVFHEKHPIDNTVKPSISIKIRGEEIHVFYVQKLSKGEFLVKKTHGFGMTLNQIKKLMDEKIKLSSQGEKNSLSQAFDKLMRSYSHQGVKYKNLLERNRNQSEVIKAERAQIRAQLKLESAIYDICCTKSISNDMKVALIRSMASPDSKMIITTKGQGTPGTKK